MAEHPFILEYPVKGSDLWSITNFRRMREHRKLTFLLNVLLAGRTTIQPRRPRHLWAIVHEEGVADQEIKWVQEFYFAKLGEVVRDELSPPAAEPLEEVNPESYYATVGHDGRGLRVPTDLDDSICRYTRLSKANRDKIDRAGFWMGHGLPAMDSFLFRFLRVSCHWHRVRGEFALTPESECETDRDNAASKHIGEEQRTQAVRKTRRRVAPAWCRQGSGARGARCSNPRMRPTSASGRSRSRRICDRDIRGGRCRGPS